MKETGRSYRCALAVLSVLLLCAPAVAQPLSAKAVAGQREVFVGEAFQFQVQISGTEDPQRPDMSALKDFLVQEQGGRQNSSRSVSIVNGRFHQEVRRGYIFSYMLTARREGNLAIPSLSVAAEGKVAQTRPLSIVAKKPIETADFKLRLGLSRTQCYAGEPITLTVTWYLGQDVRGFEFNLPVLKDPSLYFADPHLDTSKGGPYYRIPLGGEEVIGKKGRGRLEGKDYATITFRKIVIPKAAGTVTIKPATVACEALAGYREARRRRGPFGDDFFSDFFNDDFFGRRRQGVYRRVVVPSNSLTLDVQPLPLEGRPAAFAGLIGVYRIETSATPLDVSVGDPITLTVALSGPEYLEHVSMPPLGEQEALARDFRIPDEIAAGKLVNGRKVFTQTLRALRPDVKAVPPLDLTYFDTRAGEYRVARSQPIPLSVKASRIVTIDDVEGREATVTAGRALEGWSRGIAHNYDDAGVIVDQRYGPETWLRSAPWVAAIAGPPSAYFILLGVLLALRKRSADPLATRSRKAFGILLRSLNAASRGGAQGITAEAVLDNLRAYLGDRLRVTSGALTYNDVCTELLAKHVDADTLQELRSVIDDCEAGRFAGGTRAADPDRLRERAVAVARKLERKLR